MTVEEFDSLKRQDFENGAVLDDIRSSLRRKDSPNPEQRAEAAVEKPYKEGLGWCIPINQPKMAIWCDSKGRADSIAACIKDAIVAAIRADRRGEEV